MKKFTLFLVLCFVAISVMLSVVEAFAQTPQAFKYQLIAHNVNGLILSNQNLGLQVSILQDAVEGTAIYSERHTVTTSNSGLVNIEIGTGSIVSGTFNTIDWGNHSYFLKLELDPVGGTNYFTMGTSQLVSVPYALHAKTAENGFSGNYSDLTNKPSLGTGLSFNGLTINSTWTKTGNDIFNNNTGFVGIGTNTPTSALHINGSIRIADDSEGLNKVLMSDESGNATWKTPSLGLVKGSTNYIPKFSSNSSLDTSLLYQTGSRIGIGSTNPSGRMMIQADAGSLDSEPLFEIKSKTGKTVMIVYQDSVHFYVNDDASKSNNKGSFAVSGQSTAKTVTSNLFYLNTLNLLSGQNAGKKLSSATNYTGQYNTFLGFEAGYSDTVGSNNVFLGKSAGYSNNADNNVFLGFESGKANTIGGNNAFVGYQAGTGNITGNSNVFIGNNAGFSNITGDRNVFIGEKTGFSNLNGSFNSFIGYKSGYENLNGGFNTFLGYQAGLSNTGNDNTYIGFKAGASSGSTGGNVFIGSKSGMKTNNPVQNIYIGELAGYKADGDFNVYVGYGAGGDSLTNLTGTNDGSRNSFFGYKAGYRNFSGSKNVFVGDSAGYANTFGSSNVFLGNGAGRNAGNSNKNILIGENAGAGLNNGANNILIGSYNYSQSTGNGDNSNQVRLGDNMINSFFCQGAFAATTSNAANLFVGATGQIMRSTSSKRYKKDISDLSINTESIYKLRPVSYTSLNDNQPYFGLIAEEVAEVLPELAEFAKEKDVIKGSTSEKIIPDAVKYPLLSVLLLKEVQKHQKTIKQLLDKINKLESVNAGLIKKTNEIDSMKAEIEKINSIIGTTVKK